MLLIGLIAWYVTGVFSFQYWWRKEYDLGFGDAIFGLLAGVMGPIAWFAGRSIHGERRAEKAPFVVLRKRV